MTTNPRRWFRFSLRTLFVVLTVFGCWLGYNVNWVRQRREIVAQQDDLIRWAAPNYAWASNPPYSEPKTLSSVRAPGLLWLLGERGRTHIVLPVPLDEDEHLLVPEAQLLDEARRVQRLFPEAEVLYGARD